MKTRNGYVSNSSTSSFFIHHESFQTNVENCARCGEDHYDLEFRKFNRPIRDLSHWAMCPTVEAPILLEIKDDNED